MIRTLAAALWLASPALAAAQAYNPGDNAASSQTPAAAFQRPGEADAPRGEGVRFDGSHAFRTLECRGGDAFVSGDANHLRLKDCSRVSLSGSRNAVNVTLSSPGDITVSGARNAVTYRAPADGAPRITDGGEANVIRPVGGG